MCLTSRTLWFGSSWVFHLFIFFGIAWPATTLKLVLLLLNFITVLKVLQKCNLMSMVSPRLKACSRKIPVIPWPINLVWRLISWPDSLFFFFFPLPTASWENFVPFFILSFKFWQQTAVIMLVKDANLSWVLTQISDHAYSFRGAGWYMTSPFYRLTVTQKLWLCKVMPSSIYVLLSPHM